MKIDFFILAYSLLMVLLIIVITVIVSNFLIHELTESTISDLFTRQDAIVMALTRELEDGPRLLSQILKTYDFNDQKDYSQLFKNIKMQLPYSRLIYIIVLNKDLTISKKITDIEIGIDQDYIEKRRSLNKIIGFFDNIIISIGKPYHDSMNINSMVPIFIDFYENMKIHMYLFIEMDISSVLYDAKLNMINSNVNKNSDSIISLYTVEMELIETSQNYPVIKVKTLTSNYISDDELSENELAILRAKSRYHRINNKAIELFSMTFTDYIVKSSFSYDIILSKVRFLNILIVTIGVIILILLIIIGNYSVYYRRINENEILLQIETIQAKLNPHFIFNTLNSMVGLAVDQNNKKLLEAFKALSAFLRSSIEFKKDGIRLSEEIEYIKNYIEIQKLRYEDNFEFIYEIDDISLLNIYIPHFSIQPIIENCFVHAISMNKEIKYCIIMKIYRSNEIMYIDIANNGENSKEEKIKLIKKISGKDKNDTNVHLGLALIHKEIKLIYGNQFGLEILDIDNEDSFAIRLKLPAIDH